MSSSKSSQQANTSTSDLRRVLGERSISAENSNVTQTNLTYALDADVAGAALDANTRTVGASLDFTGGALATMLDFVAKNNAQTLDSLDATTNLVKDSYADAKGRGALTDKIIIGVVIVAGVIAWKALSK